MSWTKEGDVFQRKLGNDTVTLCPFGGKWRLQTNLGISTIFECDDGDLAEEADRILLERLDEIRATLKGVH